MTIPILKVQGLTKSFGGLTPVDRLDFNIRPGEILGLIGPNGSGKTTAFNLITGFYRPDGGEIYFKGEAITGLKPYQICRRGLARTFQLVKPFMNLTVFKNVQGGTYQKEPAEAGRRKMTRDILNFVGLDSKRDLPSKELTLPELKKLEMARALATRPELLLLDEVMAGLTPTETEGFMGLIRQLREQGLTVLLIEHVMKAVMGLCDRVVVISYGEKIAEGTPQEVVKDKKVIEAYLGEESIRVASVPS